MRRSNRMHVRAWSWRSQSVGVRHSEPGVGALRVWEFGTQSLELALSECGSPALRAWLSLSEFRSPAFRA